MYCKTDTEDKERWVDATDSEINATDTRHTLKMIEFKKRVINDTLCQLLLTFDYLLNDELSVSKWIQFN